MALNESEQSIGKCGRFCSDCQFFHKECYGCEEENKKLEKACIIYQCTQDKKVRNCLNCPVTIPDCELLKGINKSYCLVVAIKKVKGEM